MARLRDLLRITAAVILTFGLTVASIPTAAALGSPAAAPGFGTVVTADRAHVGRAAASVGTTVFSGDSLDTEETGSLQVRSGAARLQLTGASRVTWATEDGAAAATLKNGTAMFSTANAKAFALHASTAVIRPKGDGPTVASVSIVNPKELRVSCTRGTLAISVEDDTKLVAEGMTYRVVLDPDSVSDDGSAPAPQKPPKKAGKSRFLLFLILGTAIPTAIALHYAWESPDKP